MESQLVPEEQQTAGNGNCNKSKGGGDSVDRHCATCAILIPSDRVKKCGKCGRRAYCSRECQAIDWKTKKDEGKAHRSQGHSRWCGLSYGEEDLDWVVREKFDPSSGASLGLGVFAKRFFPSTTRIMVDTYHGHNFALSGDIIKDTFAIMEAVGPSKHLAHNCNSNASQILLKDLNDVMVIYSKRDILPDEEITINFLTYGDLLQSIVDPDTMYGPFLYSGCLETFADCRRILESRFNIICPSDCFCRDDEMDKLINASRKAMAALREKEDSLERNPRRLVVNIMMEDLQNLLKSMDKIGVSGMRKAIYLGLAWRLCVQQRKTLERSRQFVKEAYDIYLAILHPKSSDVKAAEMFLKYPEGYDRYLWFDR
ncbi:uncharacterized protein LOC118438309 [Folsomia candida]|uniref:SET domain-containing protein 14 n=1 Tax=Folsomia candida TaxID=158441 RepID=A0A226DIH5_FOLCA|nr:uncharacterized protein LOC118438309 [Folsomia candida]OXA44634.1 SET domain-containing protein 14 [Folsomia candida]